MKKKILALLLALVFALSAGACNDNSKPSGPKEEDIAIDVPPAEEVIPLPDPVDRPEMPELPEKDPSKAPYIGAYGSSTDAYAVEAVGDPLSGVRVNYPAAGKTLTSYNYIWFDVYNYSSEYPYIRFDFEEIVGTEKVAVSAHYTEGYNDVPPVGVLVESLMDGAMSFVTNLSHFNTIDKNYSENDERLSEKTVCRLFVYLDTNPSQAPSDLAGSLTISSVRFLKEGDEDIAVDNSPKLDPAVAEGSGYTLAETGESVFKAEYTPSALTADAYVKVGVQRFTGAYGRIKMQYKADGVEKITVANGGTPVNAVKEDNTTVLLDGYKPAAEETLVIDIRGASSLKELRFYLDSYKQVGASSQKVFFEVVSLQLIYTPYATEEWDSTSKFHLENPALGGKVKATYDMDVGYDYLHVPVQHWTPEFSQLVVKFKTTGTTGTGAERYGLSVNSNNVLLEVAYNKVSDLPYDETTGEYTMKVDLSSLSKLATLNFYFDSISIEPFGGTRTVEFTSIEFEKAAPELSVGPVKAYNGFNVTNNTDGSADITWESGKEAAFTGVEIKNWNPEYTQFSITVENTGDGDVKLGVYRNDWLTMWMNHTVIKAGETKTFTMPVVNTDQLKTFEMFLFWNYPENNAGSVKVSDIRFLKEVAVGSMYDVGSAVGSSKEYDIKTEGETQIVSWADGRSQYAKVGVNVGGFRDYKYLKFSFTSEKPVTVGIWRHENMNDPTGVMWLTHTSYAAGANDVYVAIPQESVLENFILFIYFDSNAAPVSAGSVTVTDISFTMEKPAEETLGIGKFYDVASSLQQPKEFDVAEADGVQTVSWPDGRSQWAKAGVDVSGYTAQGNGWLKIDFTLERQTKVGVFCNGAAWLTHTDYHAGSHTVYIQVPAEALSQFLLEFYFDAVEGVKAGSVSFTNVSFVAEKPAQ